MLTQLAVRNVVLIEALDLDFGRGLGVLLFEGAGLLGEGAHVLRVGVHADTQACPPLTHRVGQVFCSALPNASSGEQARLCTLTAPATAAQRAASSSSTCRYTS